MTTLLPTKSSTFTALIAASLLGCGGGAAPSTTTTTPETHTAPSTHSAVSSIDAPLPDMPTDLPAPPAPWDTMEHQAQAQWMSEHVVPVAQTLFQAYDPARYGEVTCATCHGQNAREVNFAMPSASLPVLPNPQTEAFGALMRDEPHAFAFMATRVEPAVAALIGETPYNPETNSGFGCFECHTMAQ